MFHVKQGKLPRRTRNGTCPVDPADPVVRGHPLDHVSQTHPQSYPQRYPPAYPLLPSFSRGITWAGHERLAALRSSRSTEGSGRAVGTSHTNHPSALPVPQGPATLRTPAFPSWQTAVADRMNPICSRWNTSPQVHNDLHGGVHRPAAGRQRNRTTLPLGRSSLSFPADQKPLGNEHQASRT